LSGGNAEARTVTDFLTSLLDQGLAVVSLGPATPASPEEWQGLLAEFDQRQRSHMAGEPPPPDLSAAAWAAGTLYELVRALAARDMDERQLVTALGDPCPVPRSAATDYSVDLFFHHLPALYRLIKRLSSNDSLLGHLLRIAANWPLCSVGLPVENGSRIDPFIGQPALRALYVDRILETEDLSRLSDPRVREAVTAALGAFPELSPRVAAHLGLPPLAEAL
jgi:hypothetical protein